MGGALIAGTRREGSALPTTRPGTGAAGIKAPVTTTLVLGVVAAHRARPNGWEERHDSASHLVAGCAQALVGERRFRAGSCELEPLDQ